MSSKSRTNLQTGDIVEIEWLDTHSTDHLTRDELEELEDPWPTLAYGVVLRNGPGYITIASEFCLDPCSDGTWIEQIPHGTIKRIRRLGKRRFEEREA